MLQLNHWTAREFPKYLNILNITPAYRIISKLLNCIYFWLHWVFIDACRPSLVAGSRDYSPVGVLRLLIAVASLVAEDGL